MKKNYLFIFPVFLLLTGCLEKCPDTFSHEFNDTELAYISYQTGDTLYFLDANSELIYYMTCISRTFSYDSTFFPDHHCKNEGSMHVAPAIRFEFETDFPNHDDDSPNIALEVYTKGEVESNWQISFNSNDIYRYLLEFDSENESFEALSKGYLNVIKKEFNLIQDISYTNVYEISPDQDHYSNQNVVYDTIYYNRDGFLKFISSQYGYVLEIMP